MANGLKIGLASGVITPNNGRIPLFGQFYARYAKYIESDLTANCVAFERGDEQLFLCSCDLEGSRKRLTERVRALVAGQRPDIRTENILLFATHTHTGPAATFARQEGPAVTLDAAAKFMPEGYSFRDEVAEAIDADWGGKYDYDAEGEQVASAVAKVICAAWNNRAAGQFGAAFGRCVLGHSRRVTYSDGTALMYGNSNTAVFANVEGSEDSGAELLYFFDENGKVTGALVNAACPSQIVEGESFVSSDYWGKARDELHRRYGDDFVLVGMCAPAGDQSPRDLVRGTGHRGDTKIMWSVEGAKMYGRRVADLVSDCLPQAEANRKADGLLNVKPVRVDLPVRKVTRTERANAEKAFYDTLRAMDTHELTPDHLPALYPLAGAMIRFDAQEKYRLYGADMIVARLDDMAFASSPFELFLDYGDRIRARSAAAQTFLAQLALDAGGYLPTEKAERGGHYSAYVSSGIVGHEGGELLVEKTLDVIAALFEEGTEA